MSESASLSPISNDGQTEAKIYPDSAPTDLGELIRKISPKTAESLPPEVLQKLSETKAVLIHEQRTHTQLSVTRTGPLPPPAELAQYNEIIPQGADRIMKMVEAQVAHRIEIEKKVVSSQQGQESKGQFFGFIIAIVGLLCGVYTAISGQPTAGAVIGGVPLVGLVSVFVYSKHRDKANRQEKKDQMESVVPRPGRNQKDHKKGKEKG